MTPRRLNDKLSRQIARRVRDGHWEFMAKLARFGVVHVCTWNKARRKEGRNEMRCGLLDWFEYAAFIRAHRAWFGQGPWDTRRDTFPMWLTPAGRQALATRPDDSNPVFGGLVEPGYQCIPLDFHRSLHEQRTVLRERRGLSRPAYIPDEPRVSVEPIVRPKRRRKSKATMKLAA
jgi:hypothetical protein